MTDVDLLLSQTLDESIVDKMSTEIEKEKEAEAERKKKLPVGAPGSTA